MTGVDRDGPDLVRLLKVQIDGDKKQVHTQDCTTFGDPVGRGPRDPEPLDFRWSKRTEETVTTLAGLLRDAATYGTLHGEAPFISRNVEKITQLLGYYLYDLAFGDETTNKLLQDALQCHRERKLRFVRIELEFSGRLENELAALPWEYVRVPPERGGPEYLARNSQLVINRLLHLPGLPPPEFLAQDTLRILVVAASPPLPEREGAEPLAPVSAAAVRAKLSELKSALGDRLDVSTLEDQPLTGGHLSKDYEPEATYERLGAALDAQDPHVVHFIGHGRHSPDQKGQLALTRGDSRPDWINDEDFANLVCGQNRSLRLVILQACESALPSQYDAGASGVAAHVARKKIQAVVAMQYPINAVAANTFATSFYGALLHERVAVDEAVGRARQQMFSSGDEATRSSVSFPVIYPLDYHRLMGEPKPPTSPDKGNPPPQPSPPLPASPCPGCGVLARPDDNWCSNCGQSFICPVCGNRWDLKANYCSKCPQGEKPTPIPKPRKASDVADAFTATRSTVAGVS